MTKTPRKTAPGASGYESLMKAQALRDAGDDAGALKECLRALALDPKSPGAHDLRSMLELRLGLPERAWESLARALELGDPSADREYSAARLLQTLGRAGEALAHAEKALALEPGRPDLHELAASLKALAGNSAAALESLERALALKPDAAGHRRAAQMLGARDRWGAAVDHLRRAAALDPALIGARRALWDALLELGRREEAFSDAKMTGGLAAAAFCRELGEFDAAFKLLRAQIRRAPKSADAHAELARLHAWHGDAAKAAAEARAALRLDPAHPEATMLRGVAAALRGNFEQALRDLHGEPEAKIWRAEVKRRLFDDAGARRELSGLPPESQSVAALINRRLLGDAAVDEELFDKIAWRQLGLPRMTKEEMPGKLEFVLESMRGNRSSPHTLVWPGDDKHIHYNPRVTTMRLQAALRFGEPDRLLAEFDALIARDPRGHYLHESRGELCLWLGRYDEAEKFIARGLELNPLLPWPNMGLAGIQTMRGDWKGALAFLEKAEANRAPERVLAVWRGEIYRRTGDPERALREFEKTTDPVPFRLGLWLNRALAYGAAGNAAKSGEIERLLRQYAPALFSESDSLEGALEALKGNRSSWMYALVTRDGRVVHVRLRGVPPERIPAPARHHRWMFEPAP